jgi:hypothetical protein
MVSGVPDPTVYTPFLPSISPYILAPQYFEQAISAYGIRMQWLKSHSCACVFGNYNAPGTPDNQCQTCHGRGVYWDQPIGPFNALLTFVHRGPTPDEPGSSMDINQGLIVNGEPTLTVPYSGAFPMQPTIWQEAGLFDIFVEQDAESRFNAQLQVGGNQNVPYQQNLVIAASGAVTIYDPINHVVVSGVAYTVSGTAVHLGSGYPQGTNYIVDFTAAPAYVAFRIAGMPAHVRPFGQLTEPRRFRLQTLDLWSRAKFGADIPIISGA